MDNNNCRTKLLTPSYSTCLTDQCDCPFVIRFGNGRICTHPEHQRFGLYKATAKPSHKNISSYA